MAQRLFDDVLLGSIELFCLAAERSSFTAAAKAAGVTPAAVSRSVGRLEERLGARLFTRTTRKLELTETGARYAAECRAALTRLADAERDVAARERSPKGVVRLSVPTTYAHHRLLPRLPAFQDRYPGIHLDLHVSNRNVTFAEEGFDLAVRVRARPDSTIVVRKLEDAELVLVASPAYLARAGVPRTVADLSAHACIEFELPSSGRRIPWPLVLDGVETEVETRGPYTCADDVLAGVTLALAGAGIFHAYRFVVEDALADGRLVRVLPHTEGASRPFNLLYPSAKRMPERVRALVAFMLEELRRP